MANIRNSMYRVNNNRVEHCVLWLKLGQEFLNVSFIIKPFKATWNF